MNHHSRFDSRTNLCVHKTKTHQVDFNLCYRDPCNTGTGTGTLVHEGSNCFPIRVSSCACLPRGAVCLAHCGWAGRTPQLPNRSQEKRPDMPRWWRLNTISSPLSHLMITSSLPPPPVHSSHPDFLEPGCFVFQLPSEGSAELALLSAGCPVDKD